MSKRGQYEENVEIDWLIKVLLDRSGVHPDKCDSETITKICKVLQRLCFVDSKKITEVKNETKIKHYSATDELQELMDDCGIIRVSEFES